MKILDAYAVANKIMQHDRKSAVDCFCVFCNNKIL